MSIKGHFGQIDMVVTVDRLKLIESLKANLIAHQEKVKLAEEARRVAIMAAVISLHSNVLSELQKGRTVKQKALSLSFPEISDYSGAYEDAIGMLSLHTGDVMQLDSQSYRAFIKDEWDWKQNFTTSNSQYLGG